MMVRRWSDRPTSPALFDINRLRAIGDWGRASRDLGGRWEDVGTELLRASLADENPVAFFALCQDSELQAILGRTHIKNPDVVLTFQEGERVVLQPADLKWSLDVATYQQISGD